MPFTTAVDTSAWDDEVLLTHEESISSTSGVQQGDPLGPFLFAATLQSILAQLPADLLNNYYLDDALHSSFLPQLHRLLGWLTPNFGSRSWRASACR